MSFTDKYTDDYKNIYSPTIIKELEISKKLYKILKKKVENKIKLKTVLENIENSKTLNISIQNMIPQQNPKKLTN